MQKLETRYGIRRERIAAKNPQANGVAERAIGLFKRALRAVTPPGGDWTEHVAEARWALMCATSRARGGKSPIELATGLAPKLKDVAPEQLEAARDTPAPPDVAARDAPAPPDVVKQGGRAVKNYQEEQLAQQLAKASAEANAARAARAAQAQATAERGRQVEPTQWQPGMVAWIEEPPSDKASKFDRLLRRSKLVVISDVDSRRHRARVCSWQTRAPCKGWVPFRRLTKEFTKDNNIHFQASRRSDGRLGDRLARHGGDGLERGQAVRAAHGFWMRGVAETNRSMNNFDAISLRFARPGRTGAAGPARAARQGRVARRKHARGHVAPHRVVSYGSALLENTTRRAMCAPCAMGAGLARFTRPNSCT